MVTNLSAAHPQPSAGQEVDAVAPMESFLVRILPSHRELVAMLLEPKAVFEIVDSTVVVVAAVKIGVEIGRPAVVVLALDRGTSNMVPRTAAAVAVEGGGRVGSVEERLVELEEIWAFVVAVLGCNVLVMRIAVVVLAGK